MKHVVGLSGGKDSTCLALALWIIEELTGHPHPEWRLREIQERLEKCRAAVPT